MILPVLTTREWRHFWVRLANVSILIAALAGFLSADVAFSARPSFEASFQTGSGGAVPSRAPGSKNFVYDYAEVLTAEQARRHQFDLNRLDEAGIPVVIYIRRSDDSRDESAAYAERLRTAWALESTPGADDGIVMLVSLSESFRLRNSLVMSVGRHALPIGQLKTDTLQQIYDEEMQPAFRRNEINLALSFGVRRILYYEGYTPPDPPALTDRQQAARTLAPWTLVLAALFGVCGPLLLMNSSRLFRGVPTIVRSWRLYCVVLATLLVLSAGLSLYGRNGSWLAVSVLGAILLFLAIRFAIVWREWRGRGPRIVRVGTRADLSRRRAWPGRGLPRGSRSV